MSPSWQEHVEAVLALGSSGPICLECLGRTFAKMGRGLSNDLRGRVLRLLLASQGIEVREGPCWICGDAFVDLGRWVDEAARRAEGFEFATYLFGVRLSPRLSEMEPFVEERFGVGTAETTKHAFNRALGLLFDRRFPGTTVGFKSPDISFLIDLERGVMQTHIASIYLLGRYRKLERGIPQTKWPCRKCRGRGCDACAGSGLQYAESVESLVSDPFVEASGSSGSRFHGAGREDIDARMLGSGRPFVLELLEPRIRTLDWHALSDEANRRAAGRIQISPLVPATRKTVEIVKESKSRKRYRARVRFEAPVDPESLTEALASLVGKIAQRTPQRVSHRRADLVRPRRLYAAEGEWIDATTADVRLETEGGLYVKELISGDNGRSDPSLAARLGIPARVFELDVTHVEWPKGAGEAMDMPEVQE